MKPIGLYKTVTLSLASHSRIGAERFLDFCKQGLSIIVRYYEDVATVFLNAVLLLVLVNVFASMALRAMEPEKERPGGDATNFAHKEYHPSLDSVYPGLDSNQIAQLIKESRAQGLSHDPFCQFKDRPFQGTYYHLESGGFRRIKKQGPWPPCATNFNIFVFGGSTALGSRVPDYETIPSYLQDVLDAESRSAVSVYNFGRNGYLSVQERALFEQLLASGLRPRMAIFIDGLNDLVFRGEPMLTPELRKIMNEGDKSGLQRLISELPITKVSRYLFARSQGGRDKALHVPSGDQSVEAVLANYLANKKMIEAISRAYDLTPIFVWQPVPIWEYDMQYHIFRDFNYDIWPILKAGYKRMALIYENGSLGENFIWLGDIQKDIKQPLYVDAVHYSSAMSEMIATNLGHALIERKLLLKQSVTHDGEILRGAGGKIGADHGCLP